MLVQRFEPQCRRFTNFHYYYLADWTLSVAAIEKFILKSMSLFFCSVFCLFLKTARTNKWSFECPTGFSRPRPTRPIWLPFTDTHSHLLAQPQSSNFSPQFTTRTTDMVNLSLSKLLEQSLFLSRKHGLEAFGDDCVQA